MKCFKPTTTTRAETQTGQVRPALPTLEAPPDYLLTPPARPKKAGKTVEEYAAAIAAYHTAFRAHIAHNAAIKRKRSMAAGIKNYRWIVTVSGTACAVAERNGGKVFAYDKPPPEGHVGEGQCDAADWCRCIPKAIIPGFDD